MPAHKWEQLPIKQNTEFQDSEGSEFADPPSAPIIETIPLPKEIETGNMIGFKLNQDVNIALQVKVIKNLESKDNSRV
jgi:hypothetical protein